MIERHYAESEAADLFERELTAPEERLLARLNSPGAIQLFLDRLAYSAITVYRAPLRVLREQTCQCFDGAVFGAAMLRRLGYPALILDLLPNKRDDDHVLALFQQNGRWGAIAKSNFVNLRFREAVYRNVRELVMSYFEHYYNVQREKTLRGYTRPLDLKAFDRRQWMTRDETMELISRRLDEISRVHFLTKPMIARLSPVDILSARAGLLGANKAGLYRPPRKKR
jgi:hypothetical protein